MAGFHGAGFLGQQLQHEAPSLNMLDLNVEDSCSNCSMVLIEKGQLYFIGSLLDSCVHGGYMLLHLFQEHDHQPP